VPPIFDLIRQHGAVDEAEMNHVFNMGLGMLVFVPAADANAALEVLAGAATIVGEVTDGAGTVTIT
jgi:phosphoribosylformylglycinamidine cyclo-ligase